MFRIWLLALVLTAAAAAYLTAERPVAHHGKEESVGVVCGGVTCKPNETCCGSLGAQHCVRRKPPVLCGA